MLQRRWPEILGDEAAWLLEKFRPDVSLSENYGFPQVPVKINEPWKIDCKELALQHANSWKSELVIDPEKSQGTGVLKRVYQRGPVLYGVIRFKFQMPFEQLDEPRQVERRRPYVQPIDDAPELKLTKAVPRFVVVEMTMDVPIDGSAGSGQAEVRTLLPTKKLIPIDELTLTVDLDATVIMNQKWEFAQKK